MLRLASLTGTGVGTVSYGYDSYGRLNSITRGSTAYNFTYDEWGRTVSTKVGDTALSTNVYDEYNRLIRVQYANGSVIYYFYDSLDRVSAINKGNATRGKANNETRLFILAIAFNIQTLCNRITNGRFGRSLFEKKAA